MIELISTELIKVVLCSCGLRRGKEREWERKRFIEVAIVEKGRPSNVILSSHFKVNTKWFFFSLYPCWPDSMIRFAAPLAKCEMLIISGAVRRLSTTTTTITSIIHHLLSAAMITSHEFISLLTISLKSILWNEIVIQHHPAPSIRYRLFKWLSKWSKNYRGKKLTFK